VRSCSTALGVMVLQLVSCGVLQGSPAENPPSDTNSYQDGRVKCRNQFMYLLLMQ
jgi:hypothetical protein